MAKSEGEEYYCTHPVQTFSNFCLSIGMALAPWNVLAGGKIRTDAEEEARRQSGEKGRIMLDPNWERNEQERKVCQALEKVASEVGAKHITSGEAFEFHLS